MARAAREIRRQDGKDCAEDSAPEQTGFCLDFHLGTRARNSVSSGRKRQLPPQGTDKDLINERIAPVLARRPHRALTDL